MLATTAPGFWTVCVEWISTTWTKNYATNASIDGKKNPAPNDLDSLSTLTPWFTGFQTNTNHQGGNKIKQRSQKIPIEGEIQALASDQIPCWILEY